MLHRIDLSLAPGEHVALVGPNGSGKTTLLLALKGGLPLCEGRVTLEARPLVALDPRVGLVFANPEDQGICPIVEDDVAFGLETRGLPAPEIRAMVEATLRCLGLWELREAPVHALSGGEAQKLALASVLALGASHLLLDEATSMLSPWERDAVLLALADLRAEGVAVLHVTHQPEEILWADRVVALAGGRVAFDGPPDKYFSSDISPREAPPMLALRRRVEAEGAAFPPLRELLQWMTS